MTLDVHPRTNLRLAAVAALSNNFREPYPTIAGANVFDSRMDPLIPIEGDLPCLAVYTDDSASGINTSMNQTFGSSTLVEMAIEMGASSNSLSGAETSAALEARLDQLEWQTLDILFGINGHPLSNKFKKTYAKALEHRSLRIGHSKANDRVAMRCLMISFEISPQCQDYRELFGPLNTIGMNFQLSGADKLIQNVATDLQA